MAELLDWPTCGVCAWVKIESDAWPGGCVYVLAVRMLRCRVHGVDSGPWLLDDRCRTSPYVAVAVVEAGR